MTSSSLPMRLFLVFLVLLGGVMQSQALTWLWLSPDDYLRESDLIAIAQIGPVHEITTPEGIRVRSATLTLERTIFGRSSTIQPFPFPDELAIYEVDPNDGGIAGGTVFKKSDEGRCFVALKVGGMNKFRPYDRLSVQKLEKDTVWWPTQRLNTDEVPLEEVIRDLEQRLKANAGHGDGTSLPARKEDAVIPRA